MPYNSKRYNPALKTRYDLEGKLLAVKVLESLGVAKCEVAPEDQPEMFKKYDLKMAVPGGHKKELTVEAEVKAVWTEDDFPYGTVHFPGRKQATKADVVFMANRNKTACLIVTGNEVRSANMIYKNTTNKYSGEKTFNEGFLEIPLAKCKFYRLNRENGKWDRFHPENN